jgi:tRNA (guanine9-N1)-methyltransferase
MASEQSDRIADIANSIEDIQPSLEASSSNTPVPLSKNAQKKAAKAARFAAQKLERRAKEKEAKKANKRIKAQKRAAGELEEDEVLEEEEKKRMMKRAKTGAGQQPFGARVCIDLGFDEMMTDKVCVSSEAFWVKLQVYMFYTLR